MPAESYFRDLIRKVNYQDIAAQATRTKNIGQSA